MSTPFDSYLGQRRGPYLGFNPVSRVQVWQWCSVMGDHNPLYLDDDYRERVGLGRAVIAPPAMMQMWTMRDCNDRYAPGSSDKHPYQIFSDMSAAGLPDNVAVSYDLTFHRYLREGEAVLHVTRVAAISDLKQTALGEGHFVTERVAYLSGDDCFAEADITYFQYRAAARQAPPTAAASAAPASDGNGWRSDFSDVDPASLESGQALPALVIPITHRLIVAGAIATQDFIPVHHNLPAAQAAGMPDIFMNILTSTGLCARYLSDWAGPASRLRQLRLRLQAPNTPGDVMAMSGSVAGIERGEQHTDVSIRFRGDNRLGCHVSGEAVLALPNHH